MTIKRIIAIAAVALTVSACTPNDIGLGNAARANYAAQIVDPDPIYEGQQVANGAQSAAAQDRYRKGTTKKPVGVKTTSGGSGSGSGGGNN
jgi:type IV pilus biogenesis protein CpaD/CtpE